MKPLDVREVVVYNIETNEFVPFVYKGKGEIAIVSTDPRDTEDSCIVTRWENLHLYYKKIGKKLNG